VRLDPRIPWRLAWALPAAVVAFALARWWRGYGMELALITGLSIGALTFVALRTLDRMRDVVGRR